jgi:flagellar basal body-associated protein FliL
MSEETNVPESDGTWSGLKKTIIGTLTTVVAGGGVWLSTQLFGGHSEEEGVKTEQVAPAAPVVINLQNNNTNQQKQQGGTTTIIKEKTVEKQASPVQPAATPAKPKEEDPW